MVDEKNIKEDLDFWATNSEESGWNISSTDEGSQKMLEEEDEKQIKIQTGPDVVDDYVYNEETTDDERMIVNIVIYYIRSCLYLYLLFILFFKHFLRTFVCRRNIPTTFFRIGSPKV
jgi:hypothetical protein